MVENKFTQYIEEMKQRASITDEDSEFFIAEDTTKEEIVLRVKEIYDARVMLDVVFGIFINEEGEWNA